MVAPYLPDIIEGCVSRLDDSFSARAQDPFNVYFEKGLLPQVRRSVYKDDAVFPLVWLVMKYDEKFGSVGLYSEASFQVIIAMPTEVDYTQEQRDELIFKPRLLPLAEQLVKEFHRERQFVTMGSNSINHVRTLLPYWGMGDVAGNDQPNLFKDKFIDAISILFKGVKIKNGRCLSGVYPVLKVDHYPVLAPAA